VSDSTDDELGPPWTFAKMMWDSAPDDKKEELREKRREEGNEEVDDADD